MSNKGQMLQDPFLNTLRKEHVPVSIYLVNGIKLQGQIESFDQYVVLLKNTVTQMVYKHAISTVVPSRPVAMPHHNQHRRSRDLIAALAPLGCARDVPRAARAPRCRSCSRLLMLERPPAAIARCSSPSTSAARDRDERLGRDRRARRRRPARSSSATIGGRRTRPDAALFAGSGKVEEIAALRTRDRRGPRHLRPRAVRRAAAQPRAARSNAASVDRTEPDPRHLRAARAQRRGQAAGRARAARAPVHAPRRRLDPPRAPEGRHRPARPGRDAARDRPPADRRARQAAEGPPARASRCSRATQSRTRARAARAHRRARRLHQRRQVDAVQPADRRDVRTRPTSCSRRSTRRMRRVCLDRARADRRCPTPSASSATCRTTSSPRSARRSRRRPRPTCCCTWSTRAPPTATSRSRP